MASNTLTDQYIALTYKGLIHAQGDEIPAVGQVQMYDGDGNRVPIRIGQFSNGIMCHQLSAVGLSANQLEYPPAAANQWDVVTQSDVKVAGKARLRLTDITTVTCAKGGISYDPNPTYVAAVTTEDGTDNVSNAHVVRPKTNCGLVTGVESRTITQVTAADGGITGTYGGGANEFISSLTLKGGIVTSTSIESVVIPTQRYQTRTFVYSLETGEATYRTWSNSKLAESTAKAYLNTVWRHTGTDAAKSGDQAIVFIVSVSYHASSFIGQGTRIFYSSRLNAHKFTSNGSSWTWTGATLYGP